MTSPSDNGSLKIEKGILHDCINRLKQCYTSEDEGNRAVLELFNRIYARGDRIYNEANKILSLDLKSEINVNAQDAFVHIPLFYTSIQAVKVELGL